MSVFPMMGQQLATETDKGTKLFEHLDLSLTMGTTGIGLDVAVPINNTFQVRTGFTYMPRVDVKMQFGVQIGDEKLTEEEENAKFDRLSGLLNEMIGTTVDKSVDMEGTPTFQNFKFLVDVFPFRDKSWHLTAGFYWGPSRVAKAENAAYDATSLVSVSLYNSLYDRVMASYESDYEVPYISIGDQTMYAGSELAEKFADYGKMGVHIGDYKETGKPYRMVPDENNMVTATMKVDNFKPYIGFGYGGRLFKNDDRFFVSFDCGVMFWGGTPSLITYTYEETGEKDPETYLPIYQKKEVDLVKDVENIGGKVGRYVDVIKAFKVFPEISVRFTRRIEW